MFQLVSLMQSSGDASGGQTSYIQIADGLMGFRLTFYIIISVWISVRVHIIRGISYLVHTLLEHWRMTC